MGVVGPGALKYCTICGAPAAAESTFCARCGRALEIPSFGALTAYCRDCGGEVALGDAHCARCGAPQPPNTAPPATPPDRAPTEPTQIGDQSVAGEAGQIAWFLFVGLWLSLAVTVFAWLVTITVVGQPAGRWLARRVPTVLTLRPPKAVPDLPARPVGPPALAEERPEQIAFSARAVYFVTVGWWASLVWLLLAWVLAILVIPIPLSEWMFDRLALITTLERN